MVVQDTVRIRNLKFTSEVQESREELRWFGWVFSVKSLHRPCYRLADALEGFG